MKRPAPSSKLKRMLVLLLCLGGAYLLCRFAFFGLHGMKAWPGYLACAALLALLITSLLDLRLAALAAPAGYLLGFVLAAVFYTHSLDPGGGAISDFWLIWTLAQLGCFLIALVADLLNKHRRK